MAFYIYTSEKRRRRRRHIYALLFPNNCCYIGQSVNLKRRWAQHKHPTGNWGRQRFTMVALDTITGTYSDAEDWECVWRCCAQRNGWTIYGLPPNITVDPSRKLNRRRSQLLKTCVWPKRHQKINGFSSAVLKIFMAVALFLAVCSYMNGLPLVVEIIQKITSVLKL